MIKKTYILITPARNEAAYIEKTIQSVISQTILPKKWVIVNDGSTDRTDEIVRQYMEKHPFIQLLHASGEKLRNFGSKVKAFKAGYERVENMEYDFIGNLDADVSFEKNYYECVLNEFERNQSLGIAGGIILELQARHFRKMNYNLTSVAGAIQLFRKECYKDIGGYVSSEKGGIDAIVEVMARMKGWYVKTFPNIEVKHHRRIGITQDSIFSKWYRYGVKENLMGTHLLFIIAKCFDRLKEKPYVIGSMIMMCGYLFSWIRRDTRPISREFVNYIRNEQKERLYKTFLPNKTFKS